MKKIFVAFILLLLFNDVFSQTVEELKTKMLDAVEKVMNAGSISITNVELSGSGLSRTLTGRCKMFNAIDVDFIGAFNNDNTLASFSITDRIGQKLSDVNLKSMLHSQETGSLFLPDDIRVAMVLSKYSISFTNGMSSSISAELSIGSPLPLFGMDNLKLSAVRIGYTVKNPLTKPELSGTFGASMAWGSTTITAESNLVANKKDWEISFGLSNLSFNDVVTRLGIPPNSLTIPSNVNNLLTLTSAKLTIKPAAYSFLFDGSSPLGKVNFVVKRSTVEGKPVTGDTMSLNTSLTGSYATNNTSTSSSGLNTMMTGSYGTSTGGTTSTNTVTSTGSYEWGIMMGYQLPESNENIPAIEIMRRIGLTNIGLVVSSMDDNIETTLPIFSKLGTGNTTVNKGFTFIAWVPVNDLLTKYKLTQPLRAFAPDFMKSLSQANPVENVMFRANVPVDITNFSLEAAINFNDNMKLIPVEDYIILRQLKLQMKPVSTSPEFSIGADWEMNIDPTRRDKPLLFDANILVKTTGTTVTLAVGGSMRSSWENPYGMKGLAINSVRLQAGFTFQCDAYCIPIPDELFFTGQLMYGKIMGDVTMAFNYNELTKNMLVARTCNLSMKNVLDQWLQGAVKTEFDKKKNTYLNLLDEAINMKIEEAYIKVVPPQAPTYMMAGLRLENNYVKNCPDTPRLKLDNTWMPGLRMAAAGTFAGYKGMFDIGAEGDLSSLQGGVTVKAKMDPIKLSSSGFKIFHLSGADGKSPFELYFDLSTNSLVNGVKGLLSDPNASKSGSATVKAGVPFFLQAKSSDKVIDIPGAKMEYSVLVQQNEWNKSGAQQFVFEPLGDGYYTIKNVNSGKNLDVQNGIAANGQPIWQYLPNTTPAQRFKLVPKENGFYEIESALNPSLIFDFGSSTANGAQLKITTRNNTAGQQFKLVPVEQSGEPLVSNSDRIFYLTGMLTILEAAQGKALIELTPTGYKCQVNGKIYNFLEGRIDASIGNFGSLLTTTKIEAEINTGAIYDQVVGKLQDVINDLPFFNDLKKGFKLERIYFSGQLSGLESGTGVMVKYTIAGKSFTAKVEVKMNGNVADFAKKIAEEIKEISRDAIGFAKKTFYDFTDAVESFANNALSTTKSGVSVVLTNVSTTISGVSTTLNNLKNDLKSQAVTTFNSINGVFAGIEKKVIKFLIDFGIFTKDMVEKIYKMAIDKLENGWDSFSGSIKTAFTGGDNEERKMVNGPAFRIITKYQNQILASPSGTKKDVPVSVKPRANSYLETWQLVPNDKNSEGSFYLVSGYSGLLITKPKLTFLVLLPHEEDHKGRERMVMESVPNEPGWYYLKYLDTEKKNGIIYTTFAEVKNVTAFNINQSLLVPVEYAGNNKPGDMGKFKFEKAGDIDWKKTQNFPPYMAEATPLKEGGRYQFSGEPEQYIYSNGMFRWIPDMETLIAAKFDAKPLNTLPNNQQVSTVLGKPYATLKNGSVIQAENDPAVYIMHNGVRRWIPDPQTFELLGLNGNMIQFISKSDLNAIPQGEKIPSKFIPEPMLYEKALYRQNGKDTVFLVVDKTLRPIPNPATLVALGYLWEHVREVPAQEINLLPRGSALPNMEDGKLIKESGQAAVYLIENSVLRHVPDLATFNILRLNNMAIQTVSSAEFKMMTIGKPIVSLK